MKKLFIILLLILFPQISRAFSIHIPTNTYKQGDTVWIKIDDFKREYTYELIFENNNFLFTETDGVMECFLGIPLNLRPGKYTLIISKYRTGEIKERIYKDIEVKKGNYPVEHIRFTPTKNRKIGSPKNIRERKLIRQALKINTPEKLWQGEFSKPVEGRISGVFGASRKRDNVLLWQSRGMDIAAKRGTPIKSPASGRVILVDSDFYLHGKTIIIDHGIGVISLYIHLDDIAVSYGQKIERGELIGTVGDTGLTTGPHLHWGVYVHSVPVNPMWWLNKIEISGDKD